MPRLDLSLRDPRRPNWSSPKKSAAPSRFFLFRRRNLILGALLLISGVAGWSWYAKNGERLQASARQEFFAFSARQGFAIQDVQVVGRQFTDKKQILDMLDVQRQSPILAFDTERARAVLEELPWVRAVAVERHLPSTIVVRLTERIPLALWQHNKKITVVDDTGAVLTEKLSTAYAHLPIIVGEESPQRAKALFSEIMRFPRIWNRLSAATLISKRRWDVRLSNGIILRLPEKNVAQALQRISDADAQHNLLSRDIVAVDVRLADRMAVQVSDSASERQRLSEERI